MNVEVALQHPRPVKLTVDDFLLLEKAGGLASYAKTELIDGLVYEVSPQFREHGFVKDEIAYRLRRQLEATESRWHVATEQSIDLPPHSQPQPDIILTQQPRGRGAIPASSIGLVVEVAVNTLRFDLEEKGKVFAAGGIPEYWVVDVAGRTVHQMWSPADGGYAESRVIELSAEVAAVTIDGLAIGTAGL